jgi:iron complex outermembrane receptor protein
MKTSTAMLAVLAAMGFVGPALAQAPRRSPEPDVAEVIVTATRSSQSLQNVPVSVSVVGEAQIKAFLLADTRDLVRLAPSLAFAQGSTTKLYNFNIRGIGSYVTSDGFDQSVGVAVDGVPLARPGGSIADLVDVERAEILEGPQGMLFGRNASAGLVNIITRQPSLGSTSYTGHLSFGSYDESQLSGTLNAPLTDSLAARVTGWRFRHKGYVSAPLQSKKLGVKDSGGVRLKLLWKPDDRLTATLTGEVTTADQDSSVTTIRAFANGNFGVRAYEEAQGTVASPRNLTTTSNRPVVNLADNKSITADVSYDLGGSILSGVTSYRHISNYDKFDPSTTSAPTYVSSQADDITYRQFSQEIRLNSDSDSRLQYVAGLIYFNIDIDDFFWADVTGSTATRGAYNLQTDITSVHHGIFGEFTFKVTPRLRAIAGGRYSRDKVSGNYDKRYRVTPTVIVPTFNGPGAPYGPLSVTTSVKDKEPSYRFGLQYDVADDVMVYATASRGYKAAGLDLNQVLTAAAFSVAQSRVKPEIAKNLELGVRSQFFARRLTINGTVFDETFTDFQTAVRLPSEFPLYSMLNAKEMKSTGATAQIDARPFRGFSLSSSVAYIHARYTDFANAPCYPGQPTAAVKAAGLCVGGVQDLGGHALSNSPRWRANITLRQEFPVGEYSAFVQANYRYQSKEVFNSVADPYERQKAYSTTNLGAGIGPASGSWKLSVYGNNIFDKSFVARTIPQNSGSYYVQVVPYDARARFGAALDVSF